MNDISLSFSENENLLKASEFPAKNAKLSPLMKLRKSPIWSSFRKNRSKSFEPIKILISPSDDSKDLEKEFDEKMEFKCVDNTAELKLPIDIKTEKAKCNVDNKINIKNVEKDKNEKYMNEEKDCFAVENNLNDLKNKNVSSGVDEESSGSSIESDDLISETSKNTITFNLY